MASSFPPSESNTGKTSSEIKTRRQPMVPAEPNSTIENDYGIDESIYSNENQMLIVESSDHILCSSTTTESTSETNLQDGMLSQVNGQTSNVSPIKTDDSEVDKKQPPCYNIKNLFEPLAIVKMPEIQCQLIFDFSNLKDPKLAPALAVGCRCLIDKLDEVRSNYSYKLVYINYQIELRAIRENSPYWKLFLRLDPNEWYELERNNDQTIKSKVKDYINRVREEHYEVISSKSANRNNTNFQQNKFSCDLPAVCEKGSICGFYCCNTHRIYMDKGYWYAAARCSEYPIVTMNPTQHHSNVQWVQMPEAWQIICEVINNLKNDLQLNKLPFERFYINFGKWQTQARTNVLEFNDCHAHINGVLTKEALDSCINTSQQHLRILQYSTKCPIDHRLDDANELGNKIDHKNWLIEDSDNEGEYVEE